MGPVHRAGCLTSSHGFWLQMQAPCAGVLSNLLRLTPPDTSSAAADAATHRSWCKVTVSAEHARFTLHFYSVLAGKEAAAARRTAARFTTWLAKYAGKQTPRRRLADDILTRLSKVRGRLCTIAIGLCGNFCSLWQAAATVPQSHSGQGGDATFLWGGAMNGADEPC